MFNSLEYNNYTLNSTNYNGKNEKIKSILNRLAPQQDTRAMCSINLLLIL